MQMERYTQSEIGGAISAVAASARAAQTEIHKIAVSTLDHTREFGDFTGCERLLNALPNGQRVKSLAQWFEAMSNGKLRITLDPKTKIWAGELSKDRSDADFDMAKAEASDYGSFKPEIVSSVVTLKDLIKKVERISTNDKTVKNSDGVEVPAVTAEARQVAAQLVAFIRTNVKVA
jgi:hypothetical protein